MNHENVTAMLTAVEEQYRSITKLLVARNLQITTMESCTSGLIASLLTDTEGSSAIIKGAYVTYSNEGKMKIGVPAELIETYTVYSEEVARSMAETARASYEADLAVGITGTYGNVDPANPSGLIGEVYFAIADKNTCESYKLKIEEQESRLAYKLVTAGAVAKELLKRLEVQ